MLSEEQRQQTRELLRYCIVTGNGSAANTFALLLRESDSKRKIYNLKQRHQYHVNKRRAS